MAKQIKKEVFGPLTASPDANASVAFVFPDGESINIDLGSFGSEVITRLAIHGLSQKCGDSYAGAGQTSDPIAYAKAQVKDVIAQLKAGDWRVAAEGAAPRASLLARALARVSGRDLEECMGAVDVMSDADKKALRADQRIKTATATIKIEDADAARARLLEQAKAGKDAEGTVDLEGLFG